MYKSIKLYLSSLLAIGLLMTGCSQQPANLATSTVAAAADMQAATMVKPTAIDAQVLDVVKPQPPKVYHQPRPMAKSVQRMVKPVQRQRMAKPVQQHKMMSASKRKMIKPVQRQITY